MGENANEYKSSWIFRLRSGLSRTSHNLNQGLDDLLKKRRLDEVILTELEDIMISADLGVSAAGRITAKLAATRFNKEVSPDEVKMFLADEIAEILDPVAMPLALDPKLKPHVILVVGVNGCGKTTTIGK